MPTLIYVGETLADIILKMQTDIDQIGLLPNGPPPVGDEDDQEGDEVDP